MFLTPAILQPQEKDNFDPMLCYHSSWDDHNQLAGQEKWCKWNLIWEDQRSWQKPLESVQSSLVQSSDVPGVLVLGVSCVTHCVTHETPICSQVESSVEWVVLLQVAPRGCSPLDLWYFCNFGPLDIWARSETWPEIVLLIFLAIQGKIQGKKIVKLFWAITFDWGVLQT